MRGSFFLLCIEFGFFFVYECETRRVKRVRKATKERNCWVRVWYCALEDNNIIIIFAPFFKYYIAGSKQLLAQGEENVKQNLNLRYTTEVFCSLLYQSFSADSFFSFFQDFISCTRVFNLYDCLFLTEMFSIYIYKL